MTFPGQVHRAPDPRPDVAPVGLVPRRRDAARSGRLRPEHRLRPGPPRRAAAPLRHGRSRRRRVPRPPGRARASTSRACVWRPTSSRRPSSCRPTRTRTSSPRSTPGAMARARDLPLEHARPGLDRLRRDLAQRSRRPWPRTPTTCRRARRSRSSTTRASRSRGCRARRCARASRGAAILIVNDYEFGILTHKTGLCARADAASACPSSSSRTGADGSTIHARGRRAAPVATHAIPPAQVEGEARRPDGRRGHVPRRACCGACGSARPGRSPAASAASPRSSGSRHQGPQPPRYAPAEFVERYRRNFGDTPELAPPVRLSGRGRVTIRPFNEGGPLSMRVPRRVAASFSPRQYEGSLDAAGLRLRHRVRALESHRHRRHARGRARHPPPARGARRADVSVARVPGAFEVAAGARRASTPGKPHAVIALAAIVRGETTHHEVLGHAVASALAALSVETGVPIGFGILTCDTMEQARAPDRQGRRGGRGRHRDGEPAPPPEGRPLDVGARRKARELALQMLYEHDVSGTEPQEMFRRSDDLQEGLRRASRTSRAGSSRARSRTAKISTRSSPDRRTTGGSPACRSSTATSCASRSSSSCTSPKRRGRSSSTRRSRSPSASRRPSPRSSSTASSTAC